MARQVFEDQFHVYHVDTIANIAAPTTTEISGGTDLTEQVTADGVQFNFQNNTASVDMLAEGKILQKPGTRGLSVTLTAVRDDTQDDFWDTFEYNVEGYLVIVPFGASAADKDAYVVKGAPQEPQPQQSGANSFQQSQVEWPAVDWDLKAVIASGS